MLFLFITLLEAAAPAISWSLLNGAGFTAVCVLVAAILTHKATIRGQKKEEKQALAADELARRDSLWDELNETIIAQRDVIHGLRGELSNIEKHYQEYKQLRYVHQIWDNQVYIKLLACKEPCAGDITHPPPL